MGVTRERKGEMRFRKRKDETSEDSGLNQREKTEKGTDEKRLKEKERHVLKSDALDPKS